MRRLISVTVLAFCACGGIAGSVFPPPAYTLRVAEDWPDVGAAVLEDVATLEYRVVQRNEERPRLVAVLDHRRRIKILDELGMRHATVRLPLDELSTVTWVKARSVHPEAGTATMGSSDTREVRRPNTPNGSAVRDLLFTIPGARVGGLVEYRYERVFLDPDFVPVWVFGGPLPVLRAELGIVAPPEVKVDYRFGHGARVVQELPLRRRTRDGRDRLLFVVTDVPAYYEEPNMPHLAQVAPWIATVVTKSDVGGRRRRLETWSDVSRRMNGMFERVGGRRGSSGPSTTYRQVRDTLIDGGARGLGMCKPTPADRLSRGEPACPRDAAAYLYAALEGSGVRFYPALLAGNSGPPVFEDFPGFYPFVAAAVAVDVREQNASDPTCRGDPEKRGLLCSVPPDNYAFLDPLCALCRYGELPTELTGGRALVLHDEGPRWVSIPTDPPERNRVTVRLRLTLDVAGSVAGGLSGEATGAPNRRLRVALGAVPEGAPRDRSLASGLFGEDRSQIELRKAAFASASDLDVPLRFSSQVRSQADKLGFDRLVVRPVDVAGPAFAVRFRRSRRYAALLEAPSWVETAVSLNLPVGFDVAAPPMIELVEPFAEYVAGFAQRDGTLSFTRRLVVKTNVIPVAQWSSFRRFLDTIEAYETQRVEVRVRGAQF